jgi:DNA-binding response OmpR family regulator
MIITGEPVSSDINSSFLKEAERANQKIALLAKSKKRILAVDDNASMRAFLYDALSVLGYEVLFAANGAEGFEQFIQHSFDLVITVDQMPGMSGWRLAELVKNVSTHTPVIMITVRTKDEIRDKMQGGNVDFMMFKPLEPYGFYNTVRASLEI